LITETLRNPDQIGAALFSDSALKVVFTTLYVDIKEPAPNFFGVNSAPGFGPQKKLNLFSACPAFAKATAGKRDKIEFQFAVPK
jgi:hypothetical protein